MGTGRVPIMARSTPEKFASPKGAAAQTNDDIARAVRDRTDGATADEVAKQVGVRTLPRGATLSGSPTRASRGTPFGRRAGQTHYQWR
jgi:hypothetical protein